MVLPQPNVILRGGPSQVTRQRMRYVVDVDVTFKLPFGNGYEHFQPTPETVERDGFKLRVFEWSRRTYVAE